MRNDYQLTVLNINGNKERHYGLELAEAIETARDSELTTEFVKWVILGPGMLLRSKAPRMNNSPVNTRKRLTRNTNSKTKYANAR